jgi:hypothetical protein
LTDLVLDRSFADELSAEARAAMTAHLGECDDCRARHATMTAERRRFLELRPSFEPGVRRSTTRVQRLWVATTVFAAAAAAILLIRARTPGTDPESDVRLKGDAHVGFLVQRGQTAERGAPGQLLRPGDHVRFTYTSAAPAYLAIYAFDFTRTASVFFPQGDRAPRLEAGADTPLDSMVELDQATGKESIHALFCDREFSVEEFRAVLEGSGTLPAPSGCRVHVFDWNKGPPDR